MIPQQHYKQALPPDKHPAIEQFLRAVVHYGERAQKNGVKLNVGRFLKEYRRSGEANK